MAHWVDLLELPSLSFFPVFFFVLSFVCVSVCLSDCVSVFVCVFGVISYVVVLGLKGLLR